MITFISAMRLLHFITYTFIAFITLINFTEADESSDKQKRFDEIVKLADEIESKEYNRRGKRIDSSAVSDFLFKIDI